MNKFWALIIFVVMGFSMYKLLGFELSVIALLSLIYWGQVDYE